MYKQKVILICTTKYSDIKKPILASIIAGFKQAHIVHIYTEDEQIEETSIDTYHVPVISPGLLMNLNANINIFYDITQDNLYGPHPWNWLKRFGVLYIHGVSIHPWINNAAYDIFDSEELMKSYDNLDHLIINKLLIDTNKPVVDQLLPIFWDVI